MENGAYPAGLAGEQTRRKRMRIAFSCANCRHSKQKCNRESPCMTCVLRGKQDSCTYGDATAGLHRPSRSADESDIYACLGQPEFEFEAPDVGPTKDEASRPDLTAYGYSNVNVHNSLGILQKLENLELGDAPRPPLKQKDIALCHQAIETYMSVLKQLPCPSCVNKLVDVFFNEANWQYTLLDQNYFIPKLERYYRQQPLRPPSSPTGSVFSSDKLIFSALLFQVLAYALHFLPAVESENLHASCLKGVADDGDGASDDATMRLLSLLPKDVINLDYIAAQVLRTAWLKNRGLIAESWLVLAQAAISAQEIGLHRDDGKLYASDAESAIEELWDVVLRRRLMVNLYLWDSQMGMVLGKSLNFKHNDYTIVPPTDCEIPRNRTSTAPFQRADYDKPNLFTVRLLEYQIHKYIPQIRDLETEGPYPRDPGKVERLHQIALDFIATLPACYRFQNPDTSYDEEFPMLVSQRDCLCATAWLFVLILHRPYIFSKPESRGEIMKAGVHMLHAQQRFFLNLKPHHYRMFTLAYLSVEPCISMLAVLIAFPHEKAELATEALRCIRESCRRLNTIRGTNRVAGQGADVIQNLLGRAEKYRPSVSPTADSGSAPSDGWSSELFTTPSSHKASVFNPMAQQPALFTGDLSAGDMADWNVQFPQTSSATPLVSPDYAFNSTTFRPLADLTANDLALAMSEEDMSAGSTSEWRSNEMPLQFQGDFGEGSFWTFVNRGYEQWSGA